jgi:hypothetical protein
VTPRTLTGWTLTVLFLFVSSLVGAIVGTPRQSDIRISLLPSTSPNAQPTASPTVPPVGLSTPQLQAFTYSHYWPAWGGVNGNPNGTLGTTGLAWRPWAYRAIACPQTPDFPNWTRIMIVRPATIAGEWLCLDHGSYIIIGVAPNGYGYPGVAWLDFLRPEFDIKYGSLVYGYIEQP